MNPNPQPASDYASRAREETLRRDQLNQSLKLLRRVREAAMAGDPIPSVEELMAMTGLRPTAADDPIDFLAPGVLVASAAGAALRRTRTPDSTTQDAGGTPS